MADQHKKIQPYVDMAELFAMPLTALIDADAHAAASFAEFIRINGFEPSAGEGFGQLRMVTFSYDKAKPDGTAQTHQVSIPLLSLLPLPSLTIKEANISFGVTVVGAIKSPPPPPPLPSVRAKQTSPSPAIHPHRLAVRVARSGGSQDDDGQSVTSSQVHMTVKVNVVQGDLPNGITQLLNMMSASTSDFRREPSLAVQSEGGRTKLEYEGDAVTLKLELRDAAGAAQPDVALFLSQDADGYLAFSENVVTTDATGRASVKVALARMPPAGSGRVFKTVSAGAIVSLPNGDSQDVSGSIILEVPRS